MHVHHLTYERIGCEQFGDLMVVCAECHEAIHEWIDRQVKEKKRSRRRVIGKLMTLFHRRLAKAHDVIRMDLKV